MKANFHIGSNRFSGLETTEVYDSYWRFAAERQNIFFRRIAGTSAPWTADPILLRHKFTNAYRASDRVSQFLIRHVIYGEGYSAEPSEVVFRIILFKLFNKIETWKLLEREIGKPTWSDFNIKLYDEVLSRAFSSGQRLYSAAYIIPPVRHSDSDGVKHRGHLWLLSHMMSNGLSDDLSEAKDLKSAYEHLRSYPSIGKFLGFQLTVDINYSNILDHSENSFVVAGPGALDGLAKCFTNASEFSPEDLIEYMVDRQEIEIERLGLNFSDLWGRKLQLIDCQNLFCEISKYARVAHPGIAGASKRTRIKQIFQPTPSPMHVWYPPKWGINERLPREKFSPSDLFDEVSANGS